MLVPTNQHPSKFQYLVTNTCLADQSWWGRWPLYQIIWFGTFKYCLTLLVRSSSADPHIKRGQVPVRAYSEWVVTLWVWETHFNIGRDLGFCNSRYHSATKPTDSTGLNQWSTARSLKVLPGLNGDLLDTLQKGPPSKASTWTPPGLPRGGRRPCWTKVWNLLWNSGPLCWPNLNTLTLFQPSCVFFYIYTIALTPPLAPPHPWSHDPRLNPRVTILLHWSVSGQMTT